MLITAIRHPENLADISLKSLLGHPELDNTGAHWLEAHRGDGQPVWDEGRRLLLTRLNERRSRLESEFQTPLILLLPAGFAGEMAALAPDLWHIRLHSHELVAAHAVDSSVSDERRPPSRPLPVSTAHPVEPEVSQALSYWLAQWRANFDDLEAADLRPDHPNLWLISFWDGVRAVEACLAYGRLDPAMQVAQDLLALAHLRAASAPEDRKDTVLRDVLAALNNVGRVAQAQGDWAGAEPVYREMLAISRELMERLGRPPEALRDVSISLNNVGRVAEAQGDWAGAEQVCRESLAIRRELVERLGGTPEALRAVSISLNNVGRVALAQGDWAGAKQVCRESLAIRRELVERLGGTPGAQDDLAVALIHNAGLPNVPAQELLAEAATIYASLARQCPQVAAYADRLALIQDLLDTRKNALPDPCPDDSK